MRRRAARATHPADKIRFLEGLRGIAALYVVLGHLCSMTDPSLLAGKPSQAPEWLQSLMSPFWYGHLAVAAFIVVSGFCLQLSLYSKSSGRIRTLAGFFARRARRILPPYYACLILSLIVAYNVTQYQVGMPWEQYLPITWQNVTAHFLMIHNLSPDWMYKINGVLWSIGLEAQLYLVFPFLVMLLVRIGRIGLVAVTSMIAYGILTLAPGSVKLYPWYLALFALGMVAAHFSHRPNLKVGTVPVLGLLIGWPSLYMCIRACWLNEPMFVRDAWLGLSLACLIYAWTVQPSFRIAQALSTRSLVALGGFSYSLYLMHHPIQQVLFVNRPEWANTDALELLYLATIGLPVILVLCFVFSLLFERPFMSKPRVAREASPPRRTVPAVLPLRPFPGTKKAKPQHALVTVDRPHRTRRAQRN